LKKRCSGGGGGGGGGGGVTSAQELARRRLCLDRIQALEAAGDMNEGGRDLLIDQVTNLKPTLNQP
jgi:hypothetical protein